MMPASSQLVIDSSDDHWLGWLSLVASFSLFMAAAYWFHPKNIDVDGPLVAFRQ